MVRAVDTTGDGKTRVLVVEDDVRVRQVAVEMLATGGYSVVTAADGEEALEVLSADDEKVDLVLSDVVMPRMGGAALQQEMERRGIEVPVVFATGYGAGALPRRNGVRVLSKPFTTDTLLEAVRVELGR